MDNLEIPPSDQSEPASPVPPSPPPEGPRGWHFVIGFLSLVPFLGIICGLLSLSFGVEKFRQGGWKLILLAFLGFGVTSATVFFYFQNMSKNQSGTADLLRQNTERDLTRLVAQLEIYKAAHAGSYPAALTDLPAVNGGLHIYDFLAVQGDAKQPPLYVYQVQPDGQTYYLFSKGWDGLPYTADDVLPKLDYSQLSSVGYRERPVNAALAQAAASPVVIGSVTPNPSEVLSTPTFSAGTETPVASVVSTTAVSPAAAVSSPLSQPSATPIPPAAVTPTPVFSSSLNPIAPEAAVSPAPKTPVITTPGPSSPQAAVTKVPPPVSAPSPVSSPKP